MSLIHVKWSHKKTKFKWSGVWNNTRVGNTITHVPGRFVVNETRIAFNENYIDGTEIRQLWFDWARYFRFERELWWEGYEHFKMKAIYGWVSSDQNVLDDVNKSRIIQQVANRIFEAIKL